MHGGSPGTPYTRSVQSLFIGSNVYSRPLHTSYNIHVYKILKFKNTNNLGIEAY